MRGLPLVVASGGHSSSRCAGLSLSRPLLLRSTSSRRAGSVVVAHGPSCSAACGILPDQGSNPCPLHWQADSQPPRHQGSPEHPFLTRSPPHSRFSAHHVLTLAYFGYEHCPGTSVLVSLEPHRLSRVAVMVTETGPLHQGGAQCSQPPGLGPRLETCCRPWSAVVRPPRPVCKSRE